jgi:hypothetical protein
MRRKKQRRRIEKSGRVRRKGARIIEEQMEEKIKKGDGKRRGHGKEEKVLS